jgi:hypothetical protein
LPEVVWFFISWCFPLFFKVLFCFFFLWFAFYGVSSGFMTKITDFKVTQGWFFFVLFLNWFISISSLKRFSLLFFLRDYLNLMPMVVEFESSPNLIGIFSLFFKNCFVQFHPFNIGFDNLHGLKSNFFLPFYIVIFLFVCLLLLYFFFVHIIEITKSMARVLDFFTITFFFLSNSQQNNSNKSSGWLNHVCSIII